MKIETFFEKFEFFADAPGAVGKMRELVLEWAVQGRLVEQKPTEGDGHALLRLIHKKNPPSVTETDAEQVDPVMASFPSSWASSKLGEVAEIIRGVTFPGSAKSETRSNGDVACLRTASVQAEIDWDDLIYISPSHVSRTDQWVAPNDIMISMANSFALVGKVAIVRDVPQKATFGAFLAAIRPVLIEPYFLLYVLRSPRMQAAFRASSSQTTNIANISLGRMRPLPFPLPPLAEQKRIVAKVDELMTLCDRLEAQQRERETQHAALTSASLARFADASTPANLQFLFHPSYTITPADLRKSILALAVQGKLVHQDPNDEPVESIVGWSEELNAEAPFEIPEQWKWTHLNQLAEINGGFAFKSTAYTEHGMRVVRISDFDEFGFKDHKVVRHPFSSDLQKFTLAEQNILMAMTGGTVGKSYFVRSLPEPMVVNQRVATIKVSTNVYPSYVDVVIRSEMTQEVIHKAKNSTNDNISMGDIKSFAIPIPPLAEQRRIVAKVEHLMALVDALETQLAASRATAANLLSALIAELTGTPEGRVAPHAPANPVAGSPRPKPQKATGASAKPTAQEATVSPRALADLRKSAGLSQAAVAKAMGLNQAYVSQMETGKRPITEEQHNDLLKIFGMTSD